jgi:hypothetical protein
MTRYKITSEPICSNCSDRRAFPPQSCNPLTKKFAIMDFADGSSPREAYKRKANGNQREAAHEQDQHAEDRQSHRIKTLEDQLAQLSMKVGTGEHAQSLLTALTQSATTNARDMANMQAAVVASYEIESNTSQYLIYPKQCLQKFSEHCKAQKGKQQHTGHPKNYVMIGLVEALMQDKDATAEEQETAKTAVRDKVLTPDGKVDLAKAQNIGSIASFAQVTVTPKKGFISIALYPSAENQALMMALDKAFLREGVRQWDPPPPKPVNKDLRKWMIDNGDRQRK